MSDADDPEDESGPGADNTAGEDGVSLSHGEMDPLMLELLVCPLTKKPLHYDAEANELISEAAKLAYPVRGGVPILLPSEARSLMDEAP